MSKTKTDMGILESESNTCLGDDSTASDRVLGATNLVVATYGSSQPDIYLAAGEGKACQTTDEPCRDSESNTHQDDGSTGGYQEGEVVQPSSMESFPSDIVQEILSRVPAESVLECKLVCKKWVTLIRGSNFANMHLTHQLNHLYDGNDSNDDLAAKVESSLFFACRIDDPDEFITLLFHGAPLSDEKYIYNQNLKRIHHPPMHQDPMSNHLVGSCNGLVCALQRHHLTVDPIYICNPLTGEYAYLPELVVKKEDVKPHRLVKGKVDMLGNTSCGFGYVRSTNEYKVVRIHYLSFDEGTVEVYTLGSGCGWRAIGKVPYRLNTSGGGMGTYVNDAIYWTSYNKILAFGLAKEEFRRLSVPPRLENREKEDRCGLVALGRHLCLYVDDRSRVKIWSLMGSSDSKETWRMEFDIDYEAAVADSSKEEFQPILLTKDGGLIFLYAESVLYCYDTKTNILKMISNEASTDNFEVLEAIAHVDTFASLQAIGENSKRFTIYPHGVRASMDAVIDELHRVDLSEKIDTRRFSFK